MLGKKLNGLCLARPPNVATASRPVREPRVAAQPSPGGARGGAAEQQQASSCTRPKAKLCSSSPRTGSSPAAGLFCKLISAHPIFLITIYPSLVQYFTIVCLITVCATHAYLTYVDQFLLLLFICLIKRTLLQRLVLVFFMRLLIGLLDKLCFRLNQRFAYHC